MKYMRARGSKACFSSAVQNRPLSLTLPSFQPFFFLVQARSSKADFRCLSHASSHVRSHASSHPFSDF